MNEVFIYLSENKLRLQSLIHPYILCVHLQICLYHKSQSKAAPQ